jgi:K+ transporter
VATEDLAVLRGANTPGPSDRAIKAGLAALTLGALGVVFGDIGTSPLYALQAVFTSDHHTVHAAQTEVYGVISLVFWAITLVVSVKYVSTVMRADDHGQGGIIALTALLESAKQRRRALVHRHLHSRHHPFPRSGVAAVEEATAPGVRTSMS